MMQSSGSCGIAEAIFRPRRRTLDISSHFAIHETIFLRRGLNIRELVEHVEEMSDFQITYGNIKRRSNAATSPLVKAVGWGRRRTTEILDIMMFVFR